MLADQHRAQHCGSTHGHGAAATYTLLFDRHDYTAPPLLTRTPQHALHLGWHLAYDTPKGVLVTTSRGMWIAFEGLDGCGKSTQVTRLAALRHGYIVREPGGTPLGVQLRDILLHGDHVDPHGEVLLFAADRAQLAADVIVPTLEHGVDVISDRSLWSSVAYQGAGRELGVPQVQSVNQFALSGVLPDIVVLLDIDPADTAARLGTTRDRIEQESPAFFERVAECFRELAETHSWVVVDGRQPPDVVTAAVCAALAQRTASSIG